MKITFLASVLALLTCAACTPGMDATVAMLHDAMQGPKGADGARLNPNFRYLRVTVDGQVAFLALGYLDKHPAGIIEVWYSGNKETLQLQNGRVIGLTGMPTEWRSVTVSEAPAWTTAVNTEQPLHWVRTRDVMPGYRFGVRDDLELRKISPPAKHALERIDSARLIWFEERSASVASGAAKARERLDEFKRPARYALELQGGQPVVVYGEQCITKDLCISWQQWAP